ncbi:MAG TPA: hypothetical protein VMS31_20670, partial [Pyrinomonadaceae bacterium]|nr:hypothetical protein [Pyrinomonadaceae bacterium]
MLARRSAKSEAQPDLLIRRTLFVAAFVVFWMLGISARLVFLQVSSHEKLVERAQSQQQQAIETGAQRGPLLDRQGRELARSIDTSSVFIAPEEFDGKTEAETNGAIDCTANLLAPRLGMAPLSLKGRIADARKNGRRFMWAGRRLSPDVGREIEELRLPGVHIRKEQKRFYPNGSLAANVLGFVGLDGNGL